MWRDVFVDTVCAYSWHRQKSVSLGRRKIGYNFAYREYSKIDVIEYIPSILKENFVIMVDDYNRVGEQNMVELLKEKLRGNNIVFHTGEYDGTKDVCIIVSEGLKFLTTV